MELRLTRNVSVLTAQRHLNVTLRCLLGLFRKGMHEHERVTAMKEAKKAMLADANLPQIASARELLEYIGGTLRHVLHRLAYLHDLGALGTESLRFNDIISDRASSGVGFEKLYS